MSPATGSTVMRRARCIPAAYWLLAPGLLWLLAFFVVPMYSLLATSLYDPAGDAESGYRMSWHVANFLDAMRDFREPLVRSLAYAAAASLLCLLFGFPLAYMIAFKAGRWRNLLLVMVIAPFFTSFLVRTLAWQLILADHGPVVDVLKMLRLLAPGDRLLATPVAVITGLAYNFLPFMVLPLYAALEKIDPRLIEAAADLYASPLRGFLHVTWPLSRAGVAAGLLLTFIPAAGDYINAELLGNPQTRMLGNVVQDLFTVVGDYPAAGALSVMLMTLIVVLVGAFVRRFGAQELL